MLSRLWKTAFGNIVMKVWIHARSPVVKLMIYTGRNLWAASYQPKIPTETINALDEYHGESTHIVNRIKSLTVPCGSRLMLIFFSSGQCFSCCLLGTDTACSPETVGFPTGCSYFDRLGRPGLRNAKLFGFPPGCSFLDREHDLRKILIRQQIHSTKNFW